MSGRCLGPVAGLPEVGLLCVCVRMGTCVRVHACVCTHAHAPMGLSQVPEDIEQSIPLVKE